MTSKKLINAMARFAKDKSARDEGLESSEEALQISTIFSKFEKALVPAQTSFADMVFTTKDLESFLGTVVSAALDEAKISVSRGHRWTTTPSTEVLKCRHKSIAVGQEGSQILIILVYRSKYPAFICHVCLAQ